MRKLTTKELNRVSVEDFKQQTKNPIVCVLDNIRSQHNIGSIFRTCDAFNVESIYLCGITATPPNREISKTALGATESVNWEYFKTTEEAIEKLKKNGYILIGIEQVENSICLNTCKFEENRKIGIIFGNEINGIEQNILNIVDYCIEIPQFGTKHSFNVSVTAGIVLWELSKTSNS